MKFTTVDFLTILAAMVVTAIVVAVQVLTDGSRGSFSAMVIVIFATLIPMLLRARARGKRGE
ncbi:hypothetical protein [Parvularcula lutaonensis]|uniref:Uncharacterized protein n=1 Tax=Parvularcula lutaonensis TaxID=491923 RepID=A0ABV7MBJ2_9PROT|nr:hypothetical protein [Parvularcula lutaonensis]GGY47337.1 hypothetical protein GCM10007148_15830 [Parvularcula lutaonensis]